MLQSKITQTNYEQTKDGASALFSTHAWSLVGPFKDFCAAPICVFAVISSVGRCRILFDTTQHNRWAKNIIGATTVQVIC